AAHVLSRTAMVVVAAALPNARSDGGLGRGLAVGTPAALVATVLAVAGVVALGATIALPVALAVVAFAAALQLRVFGGRTGDTLGATGKLVEVAALVVLSGAWS
ncbi:MAG: adenosylcobinamide-GDP ribazoletransferase, partial [Conexibacter sp.]|nr:adenosylcobinamide-GDP ribazoletransferase [Conexibacter sp.]